MTKIERPKKCVSIWQVFFTRFKLTILGAIFDNVTKRVPKNPLILKKFLHRPCIKLQEKKESSWRSHLTPSQQRGSKMTSKKPWTPSGKDFRFKKRLLSSKFPLERCTEDARKVALNSPNPPMCSGLKQTWTRPWTLSNRAFCPLTRYRIKQFVVIYKIIWISF